MTLDALVITAAGINCEQELARAFELAGARPRFVHLSELLARSELVEEFQLIGIPGGFSYGDAVAAGRIAAHLMRRTLYRALVGAIERGVPIIAPCNGFQIAVQMGLLPGPPHNGDWPDEPPAPTVALGQNESARYRDTWCRIEIPAETRCIWTRGLAPPEAGEAARMIPVAHGEGRFIAASEGIIDELRASGRIAMRYAADDNPNGSVDHIAGICDASGLVLGLMPHPERFTRWTQHPWWTRLEETDRAGDPLGLAMFRNAVEHVKSKPQSTQRRAMVSSE